MSKCHGRHTYLTTSEQERVLDSVARDGSDHGRRLHALMRAALVTGRRVAELAQLDDAELARQLS